MAKKIVMKKHFVTFLSPGTFFNEQSSKEVKKWDVVKAVKMADTVLERHGATPYAFYFSTQGRGAKDLNSKEIDRSPTYFLGGKIETLEEVEARNAPDEKILRSNMRGNNYHKIIINNNSWKITVPFNEDEGDVLLDYIPPRDRNEKKKAKRSKKSKA